MNTDVFGMKRAIILQKDEQLFKKLILKWRIIKGEHDRQQKTVTVSCDAWGKKWQEIRFMDCNLLFCGKFVSKLGIKVNIWMSHALYRVSVEFLPCPASLDVSSAFGVVVPSCFYSHGYSQLIHRHWLQLWVLNCRLRRADFSHMKKEFRPLKDPRPTLFWDEILRYIYSSVLHMLRAAL